MSTRPRGPTTLPRKTRASIALVAPLLSIALGIAASCTPDTPAYPVPDEDFSHLGLSAAEAATLLSLEQIDDYPIYTMHHYAEYDYSEYALGPPALRPLKPAVRHLLGPLGLLAVCGSHRPRGRPLYAQLRLGVQPDAIAVCGTR